MSVRRNGPVLIVTGGSRGIGAAISRQAAHAGYAVAVNYARDQSAAEALVDDIVVHGGQAIAVKGDVSVEADVVALFEQAERAFGAVTALVNNAGIVGGVCRVADLSAEVLTRVLAVNVAGVVLPAREAVRRMSTERGGSGGAIVNVSSIAARLGSGGEYVHYAMTKGAVDAFTRGLAREVAREGIRVNAVAPGMIDTEIHAAAGGAARLERVLPTIPIGRIGKPEEVAEAVLWLLSPAASYTTGSILEVGGGR